MDGENKAITTEKKKKKKKESRLQLKPVLGGVRMAAFSISSHEQTQYPEPAVFYIVGSLYF